MEEISIDRIIPLAGESEGIEIDPSRIVPIGQSEAAGKDPGGIVNGAVETAKNIGRVYPVLETAANLATSAYGIPASGIAAIGALPFGLDKAAEVQRKVQGALVYEPQTEGGKQLTEAATYPLAKLDEAGGYAGGKLEEAGYPMAGAAVHSAIQASPLLLGVRRGPAAKAAKAEAELNAAIDKGIVKSIRPAASGTRDYYQTQKYMGNAREAVKTIVENRDRIKLTDEIGESTGKLPQNLRQFSQAIDQTKRMVFDEYDAMAKSATGAGITVDLAPIVKELKTVEMNKTVKDFNPQFSEYAADLATRLKDRKRYTAEEAQDAIATLNNRLDAFYKNPTYENASKASIDSMVANQLRKSLDTTIEQSVGEGYQGLKKKYGALKSIERDVNRRAIVDARKNVKTLIDFSDIFSGSQVVSGILSMNPATVASGFFAKIIASTIKHLNDPNRIVKNMFGEVEKTIPIKQYRGGETDVMGLPDETPETPKSETIVDIPQRTISESEKKIPFIPKPMENMRPYSYFKNDWKVTEIKETLKDKSSKWKLELSDDYKFAFEGLSRDVGVGEPGRRIQLKNAGPGEEWIAQPSTYPEWMKDQGWTRNEVLTALDKARNGEQLGVRQIEIVQRAAEYLDKQNYDQFSGELKNAGIKEKEIRGVEKEADRSFAEEMEQTFSDVNRKIREGKIGVEFANKFYKFMEELEIDSGDLPF